MLRQADSTEKSSHPSRVLVLGHDAAIGGAQLSLLEILERTDPERFRPIVIVPTPGPFLNELRKRGIECHWGIAQRWIFFAKRGPAPSRKTRLVRLLLHPHLWALMSLLTLPVRLGILAAFAKVKRIDLIYTNTVTILDGALTARLVGVPHVWHLRELIRGNPDLAYPFSVDWVSGFIRGWSNRVILNSQYLRRVYFGEQPDKRIRVIVNGIDGSRPSQTRFAVLPSSIPTGARVTACCGQVSERKGIDVYLHAMARLKESHPNLHHLIIGGGQPDFIVNLKDLSGNLGLAGRVHFLGHRNDIPALLARVDVLVSAANQESFGRTLIEAMMAEVPVVATRSGGPEEIIVDGRSGFLVDVGDDRALATRVAHLLDDASVAAAIGSAGRARVLKDFSLDRVVAEVCATWEECLRGD
jgi:glycosyltransferase involved in cell wall biosynthesis